MFNNRPFQVALAISLVAHSIFLFGRFPNLTLFSNSDKDLIKNELEIIYYQIKEKPRLSISMPAPVLSKEKTEPRGHKPKIDKTNTYDKTKTQDKPSDEQDKPRLPSTVDLSNILIDFQGQPVYLNYFQAIRERIRQRAIKNYPRQLIFGEVTINFVLASSGHLKFVKIIESKSSSNILLRAAALQSVREASPFPPFPESFKQSEISFSIVILFELRR